MNLFSFILYTSYYIPDDDKSDDGSELLILACFLLPSIIAITYYYFNIYLKRKHKKIIFNQYLPYNDDNLLEAYILLSAQILKSDRGQSKEKLHYIHRYFKKHFPDSYYNFRETLSDAYKNPIMVNSVTSWIRAFMRSKRERTQIIYFLAGLCIIDGRFSTLEINRLEEIALKIKLSPKEFDSIVAMYSSNNRAHQKTRQKETRQKTSSQSKSSRNTGSSRKTNSSGKSTFSSKSRPKPRETKESLNCKILGVSTTASMKEIKKAYRKLVKIHHPDRFHNASKEQQDIAKGKFITIQKAYEYLEIIRKK